MEKRNSQCEQDRQWSKQEAYFACEPQMWLAVNHNTSGELIRCSRRFARASEFGRRQSNLCRS